MSIIIKKIFLICILLVLICISINIGYTDTTVLLIEKIPRVVSILLVGSGLSVAGLIMQQIVRNKFASPSTVGTMEFSCFGIMIGMILFQSTSIFGKISMSFLFAVFGTLLFLKILDYVKFTDSVFVPLIGIVLGKIVESVTTFFAFHFDIDHSLMMYTTGGFSNILQGRYEILYLQIPIIALAYYYSYHFTILGFGKTFTKNLGIDYNKYKYTGLVLISLIVSSSILTVGTIPYIGLVVPNIISILYGDNIKSNLFLTAYIGIVIVLVCDIISRLIAYPFEIPISTTMGVLGSAIFLYLLFKEFKE